MDERDLIKVVLDQNTADMRQMDSQRTTLSNTVLVLDVALIGLLAKGDASQYLGLLATVLGGFTFQPHHA